MLKTGKSGMISYNNYTNSRSRLGVTAAKTAGVASPLPFPAGKG